jgi:serine protease DegQ
MSNARHVFSAVALSLGLALSTLPVHAALPTSVNGQAVPSLAPIVKQVTPAVVSIMVSGKKVTHQQIPEQFRFFFGPDAPDDQVQEQPFQALGSGVIIDADKGYVITNFHVIDGADEIKVTLKDGRTLKAKKIGSDQQSDIALLQIPAKNLNAIKLANSDDLQVGDFAIAIGNPFGLNQTVTSGIISALGRSGLNIENFENFIQTDAAINSGNSGGALVDMKGELIGINTAILGPNGGNIGIGFAIPSNMVRNLTEQILKYGEVRRGILGIMGGELNSDLAKAFGYDSQDGAFVNQVQPHSAAAEAGIKAGDIIVKMDGRSIRSFGELRANVATMGAGKTIKLGIFRDGKEQTVSVTLRQADLTETKADVLHPALQGATLSNTESGVSPAGVQITKLEKNSAAVRLGLKEGDIIVGINRSRISNLKELREAMKNKSDVLALNIIRGDASLYLVIQN